MPLVSAARGTAGRPRSQQFLLRRSVGSGFSALVGQGAAMKFRLLHLPAPPGSASPSRLVDADGREIEWANRFLDMQRWPRGLLHASTYPLDRKSKRLDSR